MTKHQINNVQGTLRGKNEWVSDTRPINGYGVGGHIRVEISCSPYFSISASSRRRDDIEAGGAMHDEICRYFPELAPLLKFHLWSGLPMHYVENTLFYTSERDYAGRLKGEPTDYTTRLYVNDAPIGYHLPPSAAQWLLENHKSGSTFEVVKLEDPLGQFARFTLRSSSGSQQAANWYSAMFKAEYPAQEWCTTLNNPQTRVTATQVPVGFSKGGVRDLDAARRCAAWPEATDEQLCLPTEELKALLEQRKDALTAEFTAMIESIGFSYPT